jgi:hypothetical protein
MTRVSFAVTHNLAEHLRYFLIRQNQLVYKVLPWAETKTLVSHLLSRAP